MIRNVRAFTSVSDAVNSYRHNLNTHDSYVEMRLIGQRLRANDQAVTATAWVEVLRYHLERRDAYC